MTVPIDARCPACGGGASTVAAIAKAAVAVSQQPKARRGRKVRGRGGVLCGAPATPHSGRASSQGAQRVRAYTPCIRLAGLDRLNRTGELVMQRLYAAEGYSRCSECYIRESASVVP